MTCVTRTWVGRFIGQIMAIGLAVAISFSALAADDRTHPIDIQPQPLSDALRQLSRQTGMQFFVDSALTEGLSAPRVTGLLSAEDALRQLLEGSGLSYRIANGGVTLVRKPQGAGPLELTPIMVEGELLSRDLQTTSTSVTVITGDELDRRQDADLYDVIERTAGAGASFGDDGFYIRGIDIRGPGLAGGGLLVGVNIDGVSLGNSITIRHGPYSTWDLQQVEVLKGPQSTQQGRNALAGQIVVRSADPFHGREFKIRQDFETFDGYRSAIAVNEELVRDTLSFRLAGEQYKTDGSIEAPFASTGDFDFLDQWTLRGKLLFTPNDNLEIIAGTTFNENRGGVNQVDAALFPGDRINNANLAGEDGNRNEIYSLRVNYFLTDEITIEAETSFFDRENFRIEDADQSPDPSSFFERRNTEESITQELRVRYASDRLNGAIGVFYTDVDSGDSLDAIVVGLFGPGTILNQTGTSASKSENVALFGELDYEFLENWTLTAGARYDRERFSNRSNRVRTLNGAPFGAQSGTRSSGDFTAFLPKLGLAYDWTPDLRTGVVVQRGYRAGGAQEVPSTGEINEYDPEYTWNFEGYIRSTWLDDRLTANLNAFYTKWTDQQLVNETNLLDRIVVNAGESRSIGGELEVSAQVTPALDMFASIAYVDNEFDDAVTPDGDFSGNAFPFSPSLTASAGGTWRFVEGWELSARAAFTDETEGDLANSPEERVPSRVIVDASVGYEAKTWAVSLYARNLFDKDYKTTNDPTVFSVGEPLVVGVSGRLNF